MKCPVMLLVMLVPLFAGCGGDRSEVIQATGEILYRGAPVEGAQVMFMPSGARSATGSTDAKGHFELLTYDSSDGAVAGEHAVTVSKMVQADPNDQSSYPRMVTAIPLRYRNPTTSGLTAIVSEDGENHFRFELTD